MFNKTLKKLIIIPLFLAICASSYLLHGQNTIINNTCGSNRIVDTYIEGMVDDADNCISITNTTGMSQGIVEIFLGTGECGGNLPNTIQVSAGGQTQTLTGFRLQQAFTGGEAENMYRGTFTGTFNQVCITNLNGCADAYSMAVYVDRQSPGSAGIATVFDRELFGARLRANDCMTQTIFLGSSGDNKDVLVQIPIHEKGVNTRLLTIKVDALLPDGTVVSTQSRTETEPNAGDDAALYNYNFPNLRGDADRFSVTVCSPQDNSDSFGLGIISVVTEECAEVCPDGSVAQTPGATCDDGNPNTIFDQIQADGCTCQGTIAECNLDVAVQQPVYNDNGTPNNTSDDTFTFKATINNSTGSALGWSSGEQTGEYGQTVTFGPFPVGSNQGYITIQDTAIGKACCTSIGANLSACYYTKTCSCCN